MPQFQVECVESHIEKNNSQYGRFVLEPLDRGQGTTVGNALRRVLLGNLEGAAVTTVRINGVNHEFATIPGVREDVLDLLLNLKELVLKSHSAAPQIARLMMRGPITVTAGDLLLPSELEVINSNQYIATLSDGAVLEMELTVERGRSYRQVERTKDDYNSPIDALKIDAIFMPVRKVNYEVKDTRLGDGVDKESLTLEISTNGSISPQEALSQAANILVNLFVPLQDVPSMQTRLEPQDDQDETKQIHIEELQLSVRAYNCLKRAQINTVADLLEYTQDELLEIKNFGQKSAEEVIEALKRHLGLTLTESKSAKVM